MRTVPLLLALGLLFSGTCAASTATATTAAVSPDGTRVYAGFDGLGFSVFGRDPSTGLLTALSQAPGGDAGPLSDPSIAVSPDGANVYGVAGSDNELLQYGPAGGGVVPQESYPVLADTTVAKAPTALAVSPDGLSVYVLTYGVQYGPGIGVISDGKITAFDRDAATGNLSLVGTIPLDTSPNLGGAVGTDLVVSPDGKFVYVSSPSGGGVYVLSRDARTGALTVIGHDGDLSAGIAIAMSPDGKFVYETVAPSYTSAGMSAISVLARDPTTGRLTPVSQITNGVGGVSGLSDMWSVAVSNDGHCLYATSRADGSLGAFTRDPTTGALSFDGVLTEGIGGVTGLSFAEEVSVSGDDKNVYVASPDDRGVAVFSRNPSTCLPTFLQLAQDLFTVDPPVLDPAQGTATLPVRVQTSGTIDLAAAALGTRSSARPADATTHPTHVRPGLHRLPIPLDGQDQKALDRHHRLNLRVAVTFTADRGSATTKTIDVQLLKVPPSAAAIRKSLLSVLVPAGKSARIGALLTSRGYRVQFQSPGTGKLTISWSSLPQTSHSSPNPRPVLVAAASVTISAPRTATVKIALTKKGRKLLENSRRLRLTATADFALAHGTRLTVSTGFTLRR